MRKQKAIIKTIQVTRKGEFLIFQTEIPREFESIAGIEVNVRIADNRVNQKLINRLDDNKHQPSHGKKENNKKTI